VPDLLRVTACELRTARLDEDWAALADHVRSERSDLVVLPEMGFAPWFGLRREFDPAVWAQAVAAHERALAGRVPDLAPAVVLGTAPVERGGRRLNEAYVADEGGVRPAHHKFHLPDEEDFWEASWYERGDGTFEPVDAGPARAGFLVCTELWFGDRARAYGEAGVHLLAVPRCTPRESLDKWLAGGRTAAVVAGAYAVSSNHGDERFGGQGWIVDPEGDVLAVTSAREPFVTAEIDLAAAEQAKRTYPRYVPARWAPAGRAAPTRSCLVHRDGVACGMATYEYTTSVITHGFLGRKDEELDRRELEKTLNEMGAQGWELVKVLTHMALHREKDGHLLLFKRAAG
jgi:N-carbamoylputrescine amidase